MWLCIIWHCSCWMKSCMVWSPFWKTFTNHIKSLFMVINMHVHIVCAPFPAWIRHVGRFMWMYVDIHVPCAWFNAFHLCKCCLSAVWGQGLWEVEGWLTLFIKPEGSPGRSVRDAPSLNHVFIASICLTTSSQLFLPHDDRYGYPSPFRLCSSNVLHVWMSSPVFSLCACPPNKGTSFAWVPEQALLIDLSQD